MIGLLVVILSVGGVLTNQTSSNCGRQNITTTLVGSEQVQDGKLPWNINVYRREGSDWRYWSSGTLVTPTHVITCANCVSDDNNNFEVHRPSDLTLAAHKPNTDYATADPNTQWRAVTSVIRHKDFERSARLHNIGILVANQSFVLSSHVTVACLDWSTQLASPSSTDVLIGAAWTGGIMDTDNKLVAAQRFILEDDVSCQTSTDDYYQQYLTTDRFCAREASRDTCYDSTGGGLTWQQDGRHYLLGVRSNLLHISWRDGCYVDRVNGYTNITQHMAWIKRQIPST